MTNTKHTQGTWTVGRKCKHGYPIGAKWKESDGMDFSGFVGYCQTEANARLIAVAPELLEEMKWDLAILGDTKVALYAAPDFADRIRLIDNIELREVALRAAIAKAEGK